MGFEDELLAAQDRLRRYAYRLAKRHSDVDDLLQETLCNALRSRDSFTPGTSMIAWCCVIMKNLYIRRAQRSKRIRPLSDFATEDRPAHDPAARPEITADLEHDLTDQMKWSLDLLPAHYRNALLLHAEGASYREIAEKLSVPEGTVMSRVFRAKKMMASYLTKDARHKRKRMTDPITILVPPQKVPEPEIVVAPPKKLRHTDIILEMLRLNGPMEQKEIDRRLREVTECSRNGAYMALKSLRSRGLADRDQTLKWFIVEGTPDAEKPAISIPEPEEQPAPLSPTVPEKHITPLELTIRVTQPILEHLRGLLESGFYGHTVEDVAERLLAEMLRNPK